MEAFIQIAQFYTPKIEKALIVLAKGEDDPSEGSFGTVFKSNDFSPKKQLNSTALNPAWGLQVSVEVNPQLAECVVLFGLPYQDSKKRLVFQLPQKIDKKKKHSIRVHWQNRDIDYVEFDKAKLAAVR